MSARRRRLAMGVTSELYDTYNAHKQKAVEYCQKTHGVDISGVKLVIIPAGAQIDAGTPGNPAIYLNKQSDAAKIKEKYIGPLDAYRTQHTDEVVRSEDIVVDEEVGKCVLVKEMESGSPDK